MINNLRMRFQKLFYSIAVLFTMILTIALIVFAIEAPTEYEVASLIQIILPFLLLLNIGLLFFWLLRKKWWILLPIVALLVHGHYFSAIYQFSIKSQPKTENITPAKDQYRICSFNIHGFAYGIRRHTTKMLGNYLESQHVDILCLQEFAYGSNLALSSIDSALFKMPYHAYCLQDTGLSMAVFSKYPIIRYSRIRYGIDGCRSMCCDVRLGKDTIRIINCHLQTTNINQTRFRNSTSLWFWNYRQQTQKTSKTLQVLSENTKKRNNQVKFLRHIIDASPHQVLLCGDFNSTPASYAYRSIEKKLTDGFKSSGSGYTYSYRYMFNLFRIDYIFHSEGLTSKNYRSEELPFSDHNPVFMDFGFKI
jgi:endonuclease/exonuclease/phosphatase (EEP) superfamily protein YafD